MLPTFIDKEKRIITAYNEYLQWEGSQYADEEAASDTDWRGVKGLAPNFVTPLELCFYCGSILKSEQEAETLTSSRAYFDESWTVLDTTRSVCPRCGWWFVWKLSRSGLRTYDTHEYRRKFIFEGIIKQYALSGLEIPVALLRQHLLDSGDDIAYIHPKKFELLVRDIYKDFFAAEVRHVGGPGDNGVDLYAVIGSEPHLIQVKRRSSLSSSESVSTVREFIGTLVTEGKKNGHIVTTASHFTEAARDLVKNRRLRRQRIKIELKTLGDLFEMLQISTVREPPPWRSL